MNEFKFSCPNCRQNIQVTPEYVGSQITCPSCQAAIVVPAAPGAPAPKQSKLTKAPSTVEHIVTSPVMAAAMVRNKKKPPIGLYIGLGVAVAVAIAAVILVPKFLDKYNQHKAELAAAQAAASAPPPPPPELTADEIIKKLGETYKGLTSYSMQGISAGTVDSSQINPAAKVPQEVETKLSLRLGRPDNYRMEWNRQVGKREIKGAVWSSGNGDFVHPGTITAKVKDREIALNDAAAYSGTLGIFLAELFFDETNSPAAILKNYAKTNNETIGGQKCYVLTGKIGYQHVIFWIHQSDSLIAQTELILGGTVDEAELNGLSLVQKAQMEKAAKLRGNFTENYQDIQINKPLSANDFESSFPPNAKQTAMQSRRPKPGGPGRNGPE
jgi:hypothetical protein